MTAPLPLATVSEVRRAFYDEHPQFRPALANPPAAAHRARRDAAVLAFGLFVAELAKNGEIVPELIGRVTL